jgi:hypothetical protein
MTDKELDQALNRWKTPAPSPALRARVLDRFPHREPRGFWRPLRWAVAVAVVSGMLALGTEQASHGALDNLENVVLQHGYAVHQWFDHMWISHIVLFFGNSNLKIHVNGELQTDATFGSSGGGGWLRIPGEGKYYVAFTRQSIEGPVPAPAGRFDGHVLEFQAGGRSVRIESNHTYGFGGERPVYVFGPAAGR